MHAYFSVPLPVSLLLRNHKNMDETKQFLSEEKKGNSAVRGTADVRGVQSPGGGTTRNG